MINGNMSITAIVEQFPKTVDVFMSHGMHCFGCMAARFENLEQGARAHGVDLESLLGDLNKVVGQN